MITITCKCATCGSENITKNGKNSAGNQRYKCKACGTSRVLKGRRPSTKVDMEAVGRTFEERSSYRSTARIFGVSHVTVFNWLKKKPAVPPTSSRA